jgi:hypothetical protein
MAWRLLAAGAVAWLVADIIWLVLAVVGTQPWASAADIFFLLFYPCFLAGILALICGLRRTVAVSGTHGKTSTTAMLATLLEGAGTQPSYLVGATPVTLGRAAAWSDGDAFVVEADESDGTFLRLGAEVAVVVMQEQRRIVVGDADRAVPLRPRRGPGGWYAGPPS